MVARRCAYVGRLFVSEGLLKAWITVSATMRDAAPPSYRKGFFAIRELVAKKVPRWGFFLTLEWMAPGKEYDDEKSVRMHAKINKLFVAAAKDAKVTRLRRGTGYRHRNTKIAADFGTDAVTVQAVGERLIVMLERVVKEMTKLGFQVHWTDADGFGRVSVAP